MANSGDDSVIHHFSHQHPLKMLDFPSENTNRAACNGCKLEVSGLIYSCIPCEFYLHRPCSKMPQKLNHKSDPAHALTLFPAPLYVEGFFICNACGKEGTGFCYHCPKCQLDLHTLCAFMPLSVFQNTHVHTLNLCFKPPYDNGSFHCDICNFAGSNVWLYRCDSCDFDAHADCALVNPQPPYGFGTDLKQPLQHHHSLRSQREPSHFPQPLLPQRNISTWNRQFSLPNLLPHKHMLNPCIYYQNCSPGIVYTTRYPPLAPPNVYRVHPGFGDSQHLQTQRSDGMSNFMGFLLQNVLSGVAQQAGMELCRGFFS